MKRPPQKIDVQRETFIVIISALAVVVIAALFLQPQPVVGKAFENAVNTAGLFDVKGPVLQGKEFQLKIGANIQNSNTIGVKFVMDIQKGMSCDNIGEKQSLLGWTKDNGLVVDEFSCKDNKVTFEYAIIDAKAAKTSSFDVATINVKGVDAGKVFFSFSEFEIVDLATKKTIISSGKGTELTVFDACDTPKFNEAGKTYTLDSNIYLGNGATCLKIDKNDITVDCKGHLITGKRDKDDDDPLSSVDGIVIEGSGVTVKNCRIEFVDTAISVNEEFKETRQVSNVKILNNTVTNSFGGISVIDAKNITIKDNIVENLFAGISLSEVSDSFVVDNKITDNGLYGVQIVGANNTISNNKIDNTLSGIFAVSAPESKIENNVIKNSTSYDLSLQQSPLSFVNKNEMCNPGNDVSFYCKDSSGSSGKENKFASLTACSDWPKSGDYTICVAAKDTSSSSSSPSSSSSSSSSASSSKSSSSSSGGGGGGGCRPKYEYTYWSTCNSDLKQTRTKYDTKCRRKPVTETKDCTVCKVSWVCGSWSEGNCGTRTCVDEHSCGSDVGKPITSLECSTTAKPLLQQPSVPSTTMYYEDITSDSFWERNRTKIIVSVVAFALAAVIVVLILHFFNIRKSHYNVGELKEWVTGERKRGASDASIKKTLHAETSWSDKEISSALKR